MHVLVTGAGGFSGAQTTLALLGRGHRVTACIRSSRGCLAERAARLGQLDIVAGDLAGELALPASIDAVVHTAALSPIPGVGAGADQLMRDNVLATDKLLRHAKRSGVRAFVFFSSLSVYGRIQVPVVDETTPIQDPDLYGSSKRIGEQMVQAQSDGMRSLALRLPGVIGRGSVRNWLTSVLHSARAGREIGVFNPDAPFNNAVHVDDLAQLVCGVLERDWTGFDLVTLGASGQMQVGDVVRFIVDACGGRSRIRIDTAPKAGFMVSNARACERYGYNPMSIADMLSRFVSENSLGQPELS